MNHGKRILLALCGLFAGLILFLPAAPGVGASRQEKRQTASPVTLPPTPAGKQLAGLLEAFNTGDPAKIRLFIAGHYAKSSLAERSAEERAGFWANLWEDSHGLDVKKVEASGEMEITVAAQDRLFGDWTRLSLSVEPQEPHGILGVRPSPYFPPAARKLGDAEIAGEVKAYAEKLTAAGMFSGTVLIAKGDKTVYSGAFGLASRSFQALNRLDTKFNLGSMNKMFTAVAVAQLVEAGKLSFDDKVGKILPDYPNKDVREKVTLHQLLTHTSGMGSDFNEKYFEANKNRFRAVRDYLPLFVNDPLQFEPGARWSYSNSGFMLLGLIVEKASGEDYFDYIREHIYKPAGMTNSDCYELDRDTPNLAIGYTADGPKETRDSARGWNNLFLHVVKGGPAGGGFSTVEDLVKFASALEAGKLLSAASVAALTTGKVQINPNEPNPRYAYGFFDERLNETRVVGHGGGFPGINSQLDIYVGRGYAVAVMSNYDPPAAQRVANRIRSLLVQ